MKKMTLLVLLAIATMAADAQVHGTIIIGGRQGNRYGRVRGGYGSTKIRGSYGRNPRVRVRQAPPFEPAVNVSFGYGFPNLDKQYFADFMNLYKGTVTNQTGPFMGAIDYQFSRFMSIGVMGTYGKVNQPYYSFSNNTAVPDLTGHYENWSLMLNLITYFPTRSRAVSPYLRTAIGYNNWEQSYIDASGAKTNGIDTPSSLAYQASLGAKFNLSSRAGIFLEAGYGKYIASGGLAFKF